MKTLPKNISAHPDGWLVRVERLGVRYQAFVSFGPSRDITLRRALALRDGFYRIAGECSRPKVLGPHQRGHSNTGLPGISESCHWSHQRPHPCFIVHVRRLCADGTTRGTNKRFYYGPRCPRQEALERAKQFRQARSISPQRREDAEMRKPRISSQRLSASAVQPH